MQVAFNKGAVSKCLGILKSGRSNWVNLQVSKGLFGATDIILKFCLPLTLGYFSFGI